MQAIWPAKSGHLAFAVERLRLMLRDDGRATSTSSAAQALESVGDCERLTSSAQLARALSSEREGAQLGLAEAAMYDECSDVNRMPRPQPARSKFTIRTAHRHVPLLQPHTRAAIACIAIPPCSCSRSLASSLRASDGPERDVDYRRHRAAGHGRAPRRRLARRHARRRRRGLGLASSRPCCRSPHTPT